MLIISDFWTRQNPHLKGQFHRVTEVHQRRAKSEGECGVGGNKGPVSLCCVATFAGALFQLCGTYSSCGGWLQAPIELGAYRLKPTAKFCPPDLGQTHTHTVHSLRSLYQSLILFFRKSWNCWPTNRPSSSLRRFTCSNVSECVLHWILRRLPI